MDKYTVDLDKVLNDFEYSELTDQYVRQTNTSQSNTYSSPRTRGGNVKHSITNVFHSLNEYLNTDVGNECEIVSEITTQQNDTYKNPYSSIIDDVLIQSVASADVKDTDNNVASIAPKVGGGDQLSPEKTEIEPGCTLNEINPVNEVKCVSNQIEEDEEICLPKPDNNLQLIDEDKKDSTVTDIDKTSEQETIVESDQIVQIVEENTILVNDVVIENDNTVTDEELVENNKTVVEEQIIHPPPDSEVDKTKSEPIIAIGFDDTFELDESELNKYLDELENELDIPETEESNAEDNTPIKTEPKDEEVQKEEHVNLRESNNKIDVNESVQNVEECVNEQVLIETPPRPASLELPPQEENVRNINLIGNPGSTPYNNMYQEKKTDTNQSDVDVSSSPSPTFSDVSTDSCGSTTPSTETVNEDEVYPTPKPEADNKNIPETTTETCSSETNVVTETGNNVDDNVQINEQNDVNENNENENNTNVLPNDSVPNEGEVNEAAVNNQAENNRLLNLAQYYNGPDSWLGKQAPLWIPDSEAQSCLHCDTKFTVIKRRHHCRACGLVLCSKCCNLKYRLEYLDAEARVCLKCHDILNRDTNSSSGSEVSPVPGNSPYRQNTGQPNPNNPMEYCSMVPPLQQVSGSSQSTPTVMVPVGVLKRKGSNKSKSNKSVMFCDGIRPGSDLTNLDSDFNYDTKLYLNSKKTETQAPLKLNKNVPILDPASKSYIPASENSLPPTVTFYKSDISYSECGNNSNVLEMLKNEVLTFAIQRNVYVQVKIINMECCINKQAWCFSTDGLINVGQDEIVILLELMENEKTVPKDVFFHINNIYNDALKGTTVKELGISLHNNSIFLDSKNHAGFLYIRPTFQCLQNVIIPKEQYLVGILIHRWETPWAKIFPLRLILRLGAEYRYYPSPIISTRQRESVFVEIGHTIINLLADFRNFSYTLPQIRGLTIHMEDKNTTVTIPVNRYDQVMKSINNSSDHILAFGGNFSSKADSHLVCIQDVRGSSENSYSTYSTHAINIHNKPRKVTGASFIVFNGALKSTSGLTAKSSIVEDGLMIQILPENMDKIRDSLRNMKNYTIHCGCINAASDETVNIIWGESDINFNIGVQSPIDNQSLSGVPSIRVHNGKDYVCNSGNRLIRWTEVFILQNGDENSKNQDTVDISKLSEGISKATCQALVKYLDLLFSNNFYKIGIRTALHVENVSYCAGSNGMKLPPIYMKSLDNELIPVLHRITSNNLGENAIVLELIFRILNL